MPLLRHKKTLKNKGIFGFYKIGCGRDKFKTPEFS